MTESKAVELSHAAAMPAPQGGALPTALEWQALDKMAHTLSESNVIPYRLKGKPADVAVILLAAREYGIPPLMALSKLPVVNGTPAPMGELMVALVLRAGHSIRVAVEGEGGPWESLVAVCTTRRRGDDVDDVLRFTFREAVTAGLVSLHQGKPQARDTKGQPTPWELYTVNMLRWRAVANACRLRFPDVLLGMSYLPEELGAVVDAEGAPIMGEVVDERPAPPTGNLEERTAQETADKLAEQPWPDHVLEAVTTAAEEGGYLDVEVTYQGGPMTLRNAVEANRQREDVVEGETVDQPAEPGPGQYQGPIDTDRPGADTTQEAATASETAEEPPTEAPTPTAPVEDPQDAALDLAREALNAGTTEEVQAIYRAAGQELRQLDVIAVVDDDALATLGAPADLDKILLGGLLYEVAGYIKRHGCAVRDLGQTDPPADSVDPWAPGTSANPGQA